MDGCATPRDIAAMYAWLLAELDATGVSLIGLGFGGWIAAEMASQAPQTFKKLVLVGAMGIKPTEGDIADQAIVSYLDYPRAGFHDQAAFASVYGDVTTDQLEAWDIARGESRVSVTAWKRTCIRADPAASAGRGAQHQPLDRLGRRRPHRPPQRRPCLRQGAA